MKNRSYIIELSNSGCLLCSETVDVLDGTGDDGRLILDATIKMLNKIGPLLGAGDTIRIIEG